MNQVNDFDERGHDKYNSNFSVHSLSTSRKHKWQAVRFDLLSLTEQIQTFFGIFTENYGRKIHFLCYIFVPERKTLLSKVAGAGLFRTRYDLITCIDVVL